MLRNRSVVNEVCLTKLYVIENKKRGELSVLQCRWTRDDGYLQCVNETRHLHSGVRLTRVWTYGV